MKIFRHAIPASLAPARRIRLRKKNKLPAELDGNVVIEFDISPIILMSENTYTSVYDVLYAVREQYDLQFSYHPTLGAMLVHTKKFSHLPYNYFYKICINNKPISKGISNTMLPKLPKKPIHISIIATKQFS